MMRDNVCIPYGREEHLKEGAGLCLFLKQGCPTKYLAWVINLCLSLFQDTHMLEN